jgi:hypothetical protein
LGGSFAEGLAMLLAIHAIQAHLLCPSIVQHLGDFTASMLAIKSLFIFLRFGPKRGVNISLPSSYLPD